MFRNLSQPELERLLLTSLTTLWDQIFDSTTADRLIRPPNDPVSILSQARERAEASDSESLQLNSLHTLYLLEYSKATKLGYASPYVMLDYPTTQIPLALHGLVAADELCLELPLEPTGSQKNKMQTFAVYEFNPAGRALAFDDEEERDDFVKHAVELRLKTNKEELRGHRMPAFDYIAEGLELSVTTLLGKTFGRRPLERTLKQANALDLWLPGGSPNPRLNIGLNKHLGDAGLKTVGRIADADGAHRIIASYICEPGGGSPFHFYLQVQTLLLHRPYNRQTSSRPRVHPRQDQPQLPQENHPRLRDPRLHQGRPSQARPWIYATDADSLDQQHHSTGGTLPSSCCL